MRSVKVILMVLWLTALPLAGWAAEHAAQGAPKHHEGIPLHAEDISFIENFGISNSMIVTWLVTAALVLFVTIATRKVQDVPSGAQNLLEWLVEGLYTMLENIIGTQLVKKTFWFFGTIFIFILACNWFGLIPGVGTVGWLENGEFKPWFRGANADLNLTSAMAAVFFVCWIVWALQANGVGGFIKHIFGAKGETAGAIKVVMVIVFMLVGVLEVVSIMFRPVSLSFRLFGNVYAGEGMLEAMAKIMPSMGWLIPVPFYFMELLVGLVQALVFMLLTSVFTLLITQHDEDHDDHEGHDHAAGHGHAHPPGQRAHH